MPAGRKGACAVDSRKKQVIINAAAFGVLFCVSLYRQISLRCFPDDPFRTYLLYACYVLLLSVWAISLWIRLSQRSMRVFLLGSAAIMLTGLSIRFVQDTFLSDQVLLLRITGLLVATTMLPLMLTGLYASLCIGQGDEYRIPARWYLLLIPAAVLCPLILTDNSHHFFTYLIPEEPQPNLTYHPNVGFFLVLALIIALAVLRVFLIYQRNDRMSGRPFLRKITPFLEGILIILFFSPYIINWFHENAPIAPPEIIEQYAKLYYIEVVMWEVYIGLGLVPVNMNYREIFEQSSLGLQILCRDGEIIRSHRAEPLSPALVAQLRQEGKVQLSGRELRIHSLKDGDVVWSKDISELQKTIEELNQSAERLAQEGILIREEWKTKNEEASLSARNEIYDRLTREVWPQMELIRKLCRAEDPVFSGNLEEDRIKRLLLLGTYIKRRSNLRLTQWENGGLEEEDLFLSFQDMLSAMETLGIRCKLRWEAKAGVSPLLALRAFDRLEALLEEKHFRAGTFELRAGDGFFSLSFDGQPELLREEA